MAAGATGIAPFPPGPCVCHNWRTPWLWAFWPWLRRPWPGRFTPGPAIERSPCPRPKPLTSRSSRATPRSSAVRRSWSSPGSRATVPAEASLVVEGLPQGQPAPMTRSLEDPTFAGRVESVDADLSYRVEFDGRSTETYHVKVFEYSRARAHRRQAGLSAATRRTRAQDRRGHPPRHGRRGDRADLALPSQQGRRRRPAGRREGRATTLSPQGNGGHVYRRPSRSPIPTAIASSSSTRDGRRNKLTTEIVVNVTRNRPPSSR